MALLPLSCRPSSSISSSLLSLLLLLLSPSTTDALHSEPEQIHLAFSATPHSSVSIQYSTRPSFLLHSHSSDPIPRSLVRYGLDPQALTNEAEGSPFLFTDSGPLQLEQYHHVIDITGLTASTRYYYQVGDEEYGSGSGGGGLSPKVFSFKTAPDVNTLADELPMRLAIYGDMGVDKDGSTVLRHLLQHLHRDPDYFDAVLHVGDFAYDMNEKDGVQGDLFMRQIVSNNIVCMLSVINPSHARSYVQTQTQTHTHTLGK